MAKIKISGYSELLTIDQEKAKQVKEIWEDDSIKSSHKISINNITVLKSEIKAVFLEAEISDQGQHYREQLKLYFNERKQISQMSPEERPKKNSWGYFSFFYWGVKGISPNEVEWKDKLYEKCTQFYRANPDWCKPSFNCFVELLELEKGMNIKPMVKRYVQGIEETELIDQGLMKKFEESLKVGITQEVGQNEINVSDFGY